MISTVTFLPFQFSFDLHLKKVFYRLSFDYGIYALEENRYGQKLGSILASHRKEMKISQYDLAEQLAHYGVNVSNAAISAWEKDTSVPNANQFLALCKILGITDIYNEFIGFNPNDVMAKLNDEGKEKVLEYISLLLLSEQYQKRKLPLFLFAGKSNGPCWHLLPVPVNFWMMRILK